MQKNRKQTLRGNWLNELLYCMHICEINKYKCLVSTNVMLTRPRKKFLLNTYQFVKPSKKFSHMPNLHIDVTFTKKKNIIVPLIFTRPEKHKKADKTKRKTFIFFSHLLSYAKYNVFLIFQSMYELKFWHFISFNHRITIKK